MTLFLLGLFLSFLLFPHKIAVAAVTFLIFGDLAAKLFGIVYGRRRFFHKTVEGTVASFMACVVAGIYSTSILAYCTRLCFLAQSPLL